MDRGGAMSLCFPFHRADAAAQLLFASESSGRSDSSAPSAFVDVARKLANNVSYRLHSALPRITQVNFGFAGYGPLALFSSWNKGKNSTIEGKAKPVSDTSAGFTNAKSSAAEEKRLAKKNERVVAQVLGRAANIPANKASHPMSFGANAKTAIPNGSDTVENAIQAAFGDSTSNFAEYIKTAVPCTGNESLERMKQTSAQIQLVWDLSRVVSTAQEAQTLVELLKPLRAGTHNKLFALQCVLSETPTGMDALLRVEGKQNWSADRKKAYRTALEAATWLQVECPRLFAGANSLSSFAAGLKASSNLRNAIGESYDSKHQLACQALAFALHELHRLKAEDVLNIHNTPAFSLNEKHAAPVCRSAYVAWQHGFKRSDAGSDFQEMLAHMWRFKPYVKRTLQHGDRTALNLAKDLLRTLRKVFFLQKKNPLQYLLAGGHMGAGFNLRVKEQTDLFNILLGGGAEGVTVNDAYGKQITNEGVIPDLIAMLNAPQVENADAKKAILGYWKEVGIRSFRPTGKQINKMLDVAKVAGTDRSTLKKQIKQELGMGLFSRPTKLRLKTLEKWTVDLYAGLNKADRRLSMRELKAQCAKDTDMLKLAPNNVGSKENGMKMLYRVAHLRQQANSGRLAGKDRTDLFQFRDLKNILLGRSKRQGMDEGTLIERLRAAAEGDEVLSAVDSTSIGLNPGGLTNVGLGKLTFGGAIASGMRSREAFIHYGDGAHGFECILGAQTRVRTEFGLRFGASFSFMKKRLKVGPFGAVSTVHEKVKGSALAILIPQDRHGAQAEHSKKLAMDVTEFLVRDFAGGKTIQNRAQLWSAFSKKFDDPSRISVGLRVLNGKSRQTKGEVGVAARVELGDKKYGPVVPLHFTKNKVRDFRTDVAGSHAVNRATVSTQKMMTASVGLSMGPETLMTDGEGNTIDTRAFSFFGVGAQAQIASESAILRLIQDQDGNYNAGESSWDAHFGSAYALNKHVNGAKDINDEQNPWHGSSDGVAKYTKLGPNLRYSDEKEGKDAVKALFQEMYAHAPNGTDTYTTRWVMHPATAHELTRLGNLIHARKHRNDMEGARALLERQKEILLDPKNWQAKWLTAAEPAFDGARVGADALLMLGASNSVVSKQKTHRIIHSSDQRKQSAKDTFDAVLKNLRPEEAPAV